MLFMHSILVGDVELPPPRHPPQTQHGSSPKKLFFLKWAKNDSGKISPWSLPPIHQLRMFLWTTRFFGKAFLLHLDIVCSTLGWSLSMVPPHPPSHRKFSTWTLSMVMVPLARYCLRNPWTNIVHSRPPPCPQKIFNLDIVCSTLGWTLSMQPLGGYYCP